MAGSSIAPRFQQKSKELQLQKNLANFRLRTNITPGAAETTRLFEQGLLADQADRQQQVRTALEFRKLDEETKAFERAQGLKEATFAREERKEEKEEKREKFTRTLKGGAVGAKVGVAVGAKIGAAGGPIGAVIGGIIGAVIGRKK